MVKRVIYFSGMVLGPLIPLEGGVTANPCKVILTEHLYPT